MNLAPQTKHYILRKKIKIETFAPNQKIDIWISKINDKKMTWKGICQFKDSENHTSVTTLSSTVQMLYSNLINNLRQKIRTN